MNPNSLVFRSGLALLLVRLLASVAFGQAGLPPGHGAIEGRVADANSGDYLRNARVMVDGTKVETHTNENGEYRLVGAPAGDVVVRASFAGIGQQTARVTVSANQIAHQDFNLSTTVQVETASPGRVVKMEEFTVSARELGVQAAAIQEQRNAPNLKSVVLTQEFADVGEGNPGEFLKYVPGVQMEQSPATPSGASMRGMPANGTLVTVDGLEISTFTVARDFGFSGSDAASMDRFEVTKVPTPDMPANAVGGSINMISKSGFNNKRPVFSYHLYGTLSTMVPGKFFSELTRTGGADAKLDGAHVKPGFDFTYSRPIGKSLAVSLTAVYNNRWEDNDYLFHTWDRVRGVLTGSQMSAINRIRPRLVYSGKVDWKPAAGHLVSVNAQRLAEVVHVRNSAFVQTYGAGTTGNAHFTQGAATGVGSVAQNLQDNNQHRFSGHVILRHRFDGKRWKFDTALTRTWAGEDTLSMQDGMVRTVTSSLTNLVLRADRIEGIYSRRPPILSATRAGAPIDVLNTRLYTLTAMTDFYTYFRSDLNGITSSVSRDLDFRVPVTLKAGFSLNRNERTVRSQTATYNFTPPASAPAPTIGNYNLINEAYTADRLPFQDNVHMQFIDVTKATKLFKDRPDYFTLNAPAAHVSKVAGSKDLAETISAGYVRSDVRWLDNRLWVVAGVRFERTDDEGRGPLIDPAAVYQRNANGTFVRTAAGALVPITSDTLERAKLQNKELGTYEKTSYQDYYPSVNTSYSFSEEIVARAAYARTIGRPALASIIPGVTITDLASTSSDRTINVINTGLQPWTADNYDLSFETYNVKGAVASVGVFRKDISNFFSSVRTPATAATLEEYGLSNDYLGYEVVTTQNSNATLAVTGLELSWRQSLKPFAGVPEWTKAFTAFINATYVRISGPGSASFTDFTPKIVNLGVSYANRRILAKVNVNQTAQLRNGLLATNATTPAGSYNSMVRRVLIDGSFEYLFDKRLSLYASARNIGGSARRIQVVSPNAPEYTRPTQYNYYGVNFTFGVKGTF